MRYVLCLTGAFQWNQPGAVPALVGTNIGTCAYQTRAKTACNTRVLGEVVPLALGSSLLNKANRCQLPTIKLGFKDES